MNAIGSASDSNTNYLEDIDKDGSFDETNVGLVASTTLNPRLRLATQIHMTTDKINFDWSFANYEFNENLNGQVGKMKYAGSLVSEYVDVGLAYPWVRPPEALYSDQAEMSFEAYTGAGGTYEGGG